MVHAQAKGGGSTATHHRVHTQSFGIVMNAGMAFQTFALRFRASPSSGFPNQATLAS
jgi:hypothetical protein